MVLVLILVVCLLSQCIFLLSDEHLLIFLIVFLVFMISQLIFLVVLDNVQQKQKDTIQSFLKQDFIKLALLTELESKISNFEIILDELTKATFEVIEKAPQLIVDISNDLFTIEFNKQINKLFDELITVEDKVNLDEEANLMDSLDQEIDFPLEEEMDEVDDRIDI
jgi:hypothetical protein